MNKTMKYLSIAALALTGALMSSCGTDDDIIENAPQTTPAVETVAQKGYALPVTVNVTRQDGGTKATYNESTKKLEFSAGDKLFVIGSATAAGQFAGTLDYDTKEKNFSGTIYTENKWTGTPNALFTAASEEENLTATLLPNGYQSTGFLSIDNKSTTEAYDDRLTVSGSYAFVASETAKATGVEQLSWEQAINNYSSGFALIPGNAILNFTITGLETGAKDVSLQIRSGIGYTISGSVTPNASGVATFAIGVPVGANIKEGSNNLTVGTHNFTLPSSTTFAAGKIYNITRGTGGTVDLSTINADYTASNGEILTGTLAGNYSIDIANGATVTLYNVNINGSGTLSGSHSGIECLGNATIILKGENVVKGFSNYYAGISATNTTCTLTIDGDGSLTASSKDSGAGIGGIDSGDCANIVINGGTINATGGPNGGAGIGGGNNAACGNITINGGNVRAQGGSFAAGIGCGSYLTGKKKICGDITINGGYVTAQGGAASAGIGSCYGYNDGECSCGNIIITGGTIEATGGYHTFDATQYCGAGIGSGATAGCGTITIANTVTKVTARRGGEGAKSIGAGNGATASCGTVTIGGVEGAISESPYIYQP